MWAISKAVNLLFCLPLGLPALQMPEDLEGGAQGGGGVTAGDTLGISADLCGKDHRDTGKFLEHHYGAHFPVIFSPTTQFLKSRGLGHRAGVCPPQVEKLKAYLQLHLKLEMTLQVRDFMNTNLSAFSTSPFLTPGQR